MERNYWKNYVIKHYIYLTEKCPKCSSNKILFGNLNNINIPVRLVCNNYKCLYRTNIQKFSFLQFFPKIPSSDLFKILFKFIIDCKNATEIRKFLKENENITISHITIKY